MRTLDYQLNPRDVYDYDLSKATPKKSTGEIKLKLATMADVDTLLEFTLAM